MFECEVHIDEVFGVGKVQDVVLSGFVTGDYLAPPKATSSFSTVAFRSCLHLRLCLYACRYFLFVVVFVSVVVSVCLWMSPSSSLPLPFFSEHHIFMLLVACHISWLSAAAAEFDNGARDRKTYFGKTASDRKIFCKKRSRRNSCCCRCCKVRLAPPIQGMIDIWLLVCIVMDVKKRVRHYKYTNRTLIIVLLVTV